METSLGDGLRALRALAHLERTNLVIGKATLRERLFEELVWEAQKFCVYRAWRLVDRERVSIHRLRSILALLKLFA